MSGTNVHSLFLAVADSQRHGCCLCSHPNVMSLLGSHSQYDACAKASTAQSDIPHQSSQILVDERAHLCHLGRLSSTPMLVYADKAFEGKTVQTRHIATEEHQ